MTIVPVAEAALILRSVRLGPWRLSPYGLSAALGLVLAMALARRDAPLRGLDPEVVWDAGLFALFSCFITSRLLLILGDPKGFVHYPLLMLSLPSLTLGGLVLAALLVGLYLRRKRLPTLRLLDVFAAPGALLAAALEMGHWMDGTEEGMPTALPWATQDPWVSGPFRVHPVALYGVLGGLLLAGLTYVQLRRTPRAGRAAATALMGGGLAAFGVDLVSQPAAAFTFLGMEPGQAVALGAVLAGGLLWSVSPAIDARSALLPGRKAAIGTEFQKPDTSLASPGAEPALTTEMR